MPLQLPPLTREESENRYEYLQRHSIIPVTFYTNQQFSFTVAVPYATFSYTIPSYSGLAYIASNFLNIGFFGNVSPVQVQLSLLPTPLFTDALRDDGNILFCGFGTPGINFTPNNTSFLYFYVDLEPMFIPLPTGTTIYVHYVSYPPANITTSIVHRMVLGLVQTGLQS